jgi:hypothetical protein
MREIEGTTKSDAQLARALRTLAGESTAGAPPEMGNLLAGKFRRHHARRRVIRGVAAVGLAACLVLGFFAVKNLLLEKKAAAPSLAQAPVSTQSLAPPVVAQTSSVIAMESAVSESAARKPRNVRPQRNSAANIAAHRVEFQALPAYNSTVRLEDTHVVRLEMPGNTLRLVGVPVSAGDDQRRVLADFVVGHDGTPYAVRLLGVRKTEY